VTFASEALGTSVDTAFYMLVIMSATNTLARFAPTFFLDRKFGAIELLMIGSAGGTLLIFCWPAVTTAAGFIVWAIVWGFCSGIMSALFTAVIPDLSPDLGVVGTRIGMMMGFIAFGNLIGSPIAGTIIAMQGNSNNVVSGYLGMQMWSAACLMVATLLLVYPLLHIRRVRGAEAASH